jgi:hypothetical protein
MRGWIGMRGLVEIRDEKVGTGFCRIFATGVPPSSFDNCTTVVPGLLFWLQIRNGVGLGLLQRFCKTL